MRETMKNGKTLLHFIRHLFSLDFAATQTTTAEQTAIGKFARGRMRAVEIGVFEGSSTGIIARNVHPDGRLFAVDPFFSGRLGICWGKSIAQRELRRANVRDKVQLIETFSHQACEQLSGNFDYVFIDGDHSFDGIKQDWEDWSPRIEANGLMLLHDTEIPRHNPRVSELGSYHYFREVIAHDARFEIIDVVDSLNVLSRI